MFVHAFREFPAQDMLEAGVVLDRFGVEQLAAGHATFQHNRVKHRTPGVHRGGQAGRTGPYDHNIVLVRFQSRFPSVEAVVLRAPRGVM
jgi:hypothetical protein